MPFAAIASAVSRTTFSLILSQANVFQLFQPIGGVRASPSHFWARTGVARQRSKYSSMFIATGKAVRWNLGRNVERLPLGDAENISMIPRRVFSVNVSSRRVLETLCGASALAATELIGICSLVFTGVIIA